MLAARATREHLNGTLFDETEMEQEEPPEETDLILQDDDDDDDADEDPESTGTSIAEAVEPSSTVASPASCICAARTASVRITVFCSAIVIDVIVHCHTAGAF